MDVAPFRHFTLSSPPHTTRVPSYGAWR
jgi:hypothetical protein